MVGSRTEINLEAPTGHILHGDTTGDYYHVITLSRIIEKAS